MWPLCLFCFLFCIAHVLYNSTVNRLKQTLKVRFSFVNNVQASGHGVDFANNVAFFAKQKVIIAEIKKEVRQTGAKVIIIDNITWILDDGQDAKMAIPFMKEIVSLKNENNISIMIIAHTPKRKPMTTMIKGQLVSYDTPLELSDMAGSAALNNFIDSCFAIGKSRQDDSLRYIKQLKSRSSELIHGSDNVINFSIGRDENGFLSLEEMGNGPEINHLQTPPRDRVEARRSQVNTLHSQGLSYREIGRRLGISHTQVRRDIEA